MNKENLIELTNKLYKITLLFPKKEPLRYKIREAADEILANFVSWEVSHSFNPVKAVAEKDLIFEIERDLEVLKSYFEIAKWQNWVNYFDVLEIEEKYDKIECDFKKEIESPEQEKSLKMEFPKINRGRASVANLDSRKEKILEILKEKEKIQVGQLKELLPDVSKRTLRRDFEQLLKQGLVERIGERNNTFYQLR